MKAYKPLNDRLASMVDRPLGIRQYAFVWMYDEMPEDNIEAR